MARMTFKAIVFVALLCALSLGMNLLVGAQEKPAKPTEETAQTEKQVQPATKQQEKKPMEKATDTKSITFKAWLVDPEKKAAMKEASVQVDVKGLKIVDPATVNNQVKAGQGHIHYQVDDGPVIATTATKLSFHGLTSGEHKIVVMLAANDHSPLGPQETLTVKVP